MNVAMLLAQKKDKLFTIEQEQSICECIDTLNRHNIGALLVVDRNQQLTGIVSERDILKKTHSKPTDVCSVTVKDAMTPRDKLVTASQKCSVCEVMEMMTENRVRHLPILDDDGQLRGIVSIGDVVKALLDNALVENKSLKDYIAGTLCS